jgi:hypothetical protein
MRLNTKWFSLLFITLIPLVTSTCKKKVPECGCNSPIVATLTTEPGALYFDTYAKQFVVVGGGLNGANNGMGVICNTESPAFSAILDSAKKATVHVTFSGFTRKYCESDTLIYPNQPYSLELSQLNYN